MGRRLSTLRVSELIDLRCGDVVLGTGAHVRCRGKGRKDRSTPLRTDTVAVLGAWLDERADTTDRPLFVRNRNGRLISVPFGHYDEPEILRYENTSACPIGADVRQI